MTQVESWLLLTPSKRWFPRKMIPSFFHYTMYQYHMLPYSLDYRVTQCRNWPHQKSWSREIYGSEMKWSLQRVISSKKTRHRLIPLRTFFQILNFHITSKCMPKRASGIGCRSQKLYQSFLFQAAAVAAAAAEYQTILDRRWFGAV